MIRSDKPAARVGLLRATVLLGLISLTVAAALHAQTPDEDTPLARKQKMIQDRFDRFQDQLFRLREELSQTEPENAARLGRALERAGELGLQDQLADIVALLNDPSLLVDATDAQQAWLENADTLLNILLERDGTNDERDDRMDQLNEYRRQVGEMLKEQQQLRDASGEAALSQRMLQQLEHAIQRVDAAIQKQQAISQDASSPTQTADEQTDLSRETKQLAEDVKRLSELKSADESPDTPDMEAARGKMEDASESLSQGAQSMSQAAQAMQQSQSGASDSSEQDAQNALEEARDRLEEARDALSQEADTQSQSEQQESLAEKAQSLSEQMQQDAAKQQQGGQQGQQGQQGEQSQPGAQSLQQAQKSMDNASKSLGKQQPAEATPHQDRAIDQLQQAQKELEEELEELRKEERAEMLRDLEARFREMLIKQRGINDSTLAVDAIGEENFKRAERLQVADLAADEGKLAEAATTCLQILEEDATTIVFPHVLGQLSEDMRLVEKRLKALKVGKVTQTVEDEIVQTLEQLLDAVERMQQDNEQGPSQAGQSQSGQDSPLLPESAELKLLRASQLRVNTRTEVLAEAMDEGTESKDTAPDAIASLAQRQKECADIAREMRDSKNP